MPCAAAKCSVLLKKLCLSKEVAEKFPNMLPHQRLDDLTATRQETITRRISTYDAIFLWVPPFLELRCHCTKLCCCCTERSFWHFVGFTCANPTFTFKCYSPHDQGLRRRTTNCNRCFNFPSIQSCRRHSNGLQSRILRWWQQACWRKHPTAETPEARGTNLLPGQQWGWDGIDRMKTVHPDKEMPSFKHGWSVRNKRYQEIWLFSIPTPFFQSVVCKSTSDALEEIKAASLTWGEFLCYIGICYLMSTAQGFSSDGF